MGSKCKAIIDSCEVTLIFLQYVDCWHFYHYELMWIPQRTTMIPSKYKINLTIRYQLGLF